jgi:hypothetical protein
MIASPQGNLTYIVARDTNITSYSNVILSIQSGYASMFSIYNVHSLQTNISDIQVGVSPHYSADFIATTINDKANIFRIYERPFMIFEEWSTDFSANLTFTNDKLNRYTYLFKINVVYAESQQNNLRLDLD